jgi:hypothetical protein
MFAKEQDWDFFGQSELISALAELEQSSQENVTRLRAHERLQIRVPLKVQPGNASERGRNSLECVTADISNGGCMVIGPRPLLPGDVFWLTFDADRLTVGSLFARCMRCRMISEEAFEIGFRFFADVQIAGALGEEVELKA